MIVGVPDERRCVVVGAGLLGLSAAWALSRRGWRVTVLEAGAAVGHPRAGSKGDARIFRLGYPDACHVELAIRARSLWRDLETATGRRLLHVCGQVTFGDRAALDAIGASLAAADVPAEELSAQEAARRFPELAVTGPALFEPGSGSLAADACLRALCEDARFELRTASRVAGFHERPHGIEVVLGGGKSLDADMAIDCAGPATLALLGASAVERARRVTAPPSLPQVAYFRVASAPGTAGTLPPVFIEWGDDMLYGLPVPAGGAFASATYKVSHHTPGSPVLDTADPNGALPAGTEDVGFDDDPALLAMLSGAVRRLLPTLDPTPVASERCVYDNSADTDFILDRVGHVVVGCGTSGHGFKFGPLLGVLLADLAEGAAPEGDLRRFAIDRTPSPP